MSSILPLYITSYSPPEQPNSSSSDSETLDFPSNVKVYADMSLDQASALMQKKPSKCSATTLSGVMLAVTTVALATFWFVYEAQLSSPNP